jgi:hypothetical protein
MCRGSNNACSRRRYAAVLSRHDFGIRGTLTGEVRRRHRSAADAHRYINSNLFINHGRAKVLACPVRSAGFILSSSEGPVAPTPIAAPTPAPVGALD